MAAAAKHSAIEHSGSGKSTARVGTEQIQRAAIAAEAGNSSARDIAKTVVGQLIIL